MVGERFHDLDLLNHLFWRPRYTHVWLARCYVACYDFSFFSPFTLSSICRLVWDIPWPAGGSQPLVSHSAVLCARHALLAECAAEAPLPGIGALSESLKHCNDVPERQIIYRERRRAVCVISVTCWIEISSSIHASVTSTPPRASMTGKQHTVVPVPVAVLLVEVIVQEPA